MSEFEKKLVLQLVDGKWEIKKLEISPGALPLTMRDVMVIYRTLKVAQRRQVRELSLAQSKAKKEF
jgi:hypothetical protein